MKLQRNRIVAWVLCIVLCIQLVPIYTGAAGSIQTMSEKANAEYMYGTWVGTYTGSEDRNIVLEIDYCNSDGVFQGCATIDNGAVKYAFSGNVDFQSGAVSFIGKEWLVNEAGFTKFVEFSGTLYFSANEIKGYVGGNTNQTFKLTKDSDKYTSMRKDLSKLPVDWTGWYDGKNGDNMVPRNLELYITEIDEIGNISGTALVFPREGADESLAANGSYYFKGTISPYTLKIDVQGYVWTFHPLGKNNQDFGFVALTGYINTDDNIITGTTPSGAWTMSVIDYKAFDKHTGFKIEENGASFNNGNQGDEIYKNFIGFYKINKYRIYDPTYSKRLLDRAKNASEIDAALVAMNEEWGGGCYSLAVTMSLLFNGDISVRDLTDNKNVSEDATYHQMEAPWKDLKFLSVLNTWHVSQEISIGNYQKIAETKTFCHDILAMGKNKGDNVDSLPVFLKKMVQECMESKVFVLFYSYLPKIDLPAGFSVMAGTTSHAVLVTGCHYDAEKEEYVLEIYDINDAVYNGAKLENECGEFRISKYFSEFCYVHKKNDEIVSTEIGNGKWEQESTEEWVGLFLINGDSLSEIKDGIHGIDVQATSTTNKETNSQEPEESHSVLWFRMGGEAFTIVNDKGEYLAYDGKRLNGTMAFYDIAATAAGEQSRFGIETDYSPSFTVTNIESSIDLRVVNKEAFMALNGTNLATATLDEVSGIEIDGSQYSFEAVLSTDEITEGRHGLVSVSTDVASGKVKVESEGTFVTVSAEEALEDVTTKTYIDTEVYEQKLRDSMTELTVDANDTTTNILDFTDVPFDSFYYDPVLWAVKENVTSGATATTFNPNGECLRAQVVTFLWRAAGCPMPTAVENPFEDVTEGDYYYNAVLWAVEKGITAGVDATHFAPKQSCSRAQVVAFLHRAMGSPKVSAESSPFTDVVAGEWYELPVLWAVENGITAGLTPDTFGVNTVCNRAQVVTFLYRTYHK